MEDFGVIEQNCEHIDFDVEENGKLVVEEPKKEEPKKEEPKKVKETTNKTPTNRCLFIKKNGKQCRQNGKPNQTGGSIINGYCSYHT